MDHRRRTGRYAGCPRKLQPLRQTLESSFTGSFFGRRVLPLPLPRSESSVSRKSRTTKLEQHSHTGQQQQQQQGQQHQDRSLLAGQSAAISRTKLFFSFELFASSSPIFFTSSPPVLLSSFENFTIPHRSQNRPCFLFCSSTPSDLWPICVAISMLSFVLFCGGEEWGLLLASTKLVEKNRTTRRMNGHSNPEEPRRILHGPTSWAGRCFRVRRSCVRTSSGRFLKTARRGLTASCSSRSQHGSLRTSLRRILFNRSKSKFEIRLRTRLVAVRL